VAYARGSGGQQSLITKYIMWVFQMNIIGANAAGAANGRKGGGCV